MDIVIFGASGDLAKKKLFPAINSLFTEGVLDDSTHVFGFSRSPSGNGGYSFNYQGVIGNYDSIDDLLKIKELLRPDKKHIFYLAVPPAVYSNLLSSIYKSGLATKDDPADLRLIMVEKPFGEGSKGAEDLMVLTNKYFSDNQLLKVDHYAGKKELRDLAELSHDLNKINKVSFEIFEKADVDNRKGYYEKVGALRDVGQNHLLFMLSSFFRKLGDRAGVLPHLKKKSSEEHVFAKYDGFDTTDTFFSIPAFLERDDANHIDIRLSSGKALSENISRIVIELDSGEKKAIVLSSGQDAHAEILKDAILGNYSNFLSDEEVREAWRFIEEIEVLKKETEHHVYQKGSTVEMVLNTGIVGP